MIRNLGFLILFLAIFIIYIITIIYEKRSGKFNKFFNIFSVFILFGLINLFYVYKLDIKIIVKIIALSLSIFVMLISFVIWLINYRSEE